MRTFIIGKIIIGMIMEVTIRVIIMMMIIGGEDNLIVKVLTITVTVATVNHLVI